MPPKIECVLPQHQLVPNCTSPPTPPTGYVLLYLDQADGKLKVIKPGGSIVDLEATGGAGSAAWGGITGTLSAQTDLQGALDGKAAASHAHTIANVTSLQTTLDGKAASSHGHAISDTTGLQGALDGKSATGHGHAIADVTGLQTALNAKQNTPIANADLGSGTADSTTFLRGDRTWGTPSGGGSSTALGYQEYQHVSGGSGISCYQIAGTVNSTALTTGGPTANVLRAIPFVCPARGGTIDQLAFFVATAVAGNARIGLYANTSAGNLYPGALIAGSGDIATGTTGLKTFATTQVLTAGAVYWLAIVSNLAPTLRCLALASMPPFLGLPAAFGTALQVGISRSFTYGALPNPFGAGGAGITAIPIPALGYRLSA
jgi:hypothetical protein